MVTPVMLVQLEGQLQRWIDARVIDASTAERIRSFEQRLPARTTRNWPMMVAVVFGSVMLAAGILLFAAAHWENLSPTARFELVLLMVGLLHVLGVITRERSPNLSSAMHVVGTISCGAGIFLSGQIFNLSEHWPTGILLWALGGWIGWLLLQDWPQAVLAAVLTPAWLASEWEVATNHLSGGEHVGVEGVLLLAIVYLAARCAAFDSPFRKGLNWIGGLVFIPSYLFLAFEGTWFERESLPTHLRIIGWSFALLGPICVAFLLRRKNAWPVVPAAVWLVAFGHLPFRLRTTDLSLGLYAWYTIGPYVWGALGSIGLIAWGVRDRIKNRVKLGMVMFVITLVCFYFSDLLDKLDRSVSLIGLGVLFLVIGYFLETTRKKLMAQ